MPAQKRGHAMPAYKITYFHFRAVAECPRQILALADQKFEDERVDKETQWPAVKPTTPFGQVPVLTIDGKTQLGQSYAICRYLARQFGSAGKTPIEEAQVDAIADQFKDYQAEVKAFYYVAIGVLQGDKDELYKTVMVAGRDKFFPVVQKWLQENPAGYLVGEGITWADLLISEHVATIRDFYPDFCDQYPEVIAWMNKVRAHPNIAKWIETRPKTHA